MKQTTLPWSSPKKPEDPSPDAAEKSGGPLLIRRSFSQVWSEPGEALEVEEEILEESLQEALHKKRKWEPAGTWRRKSGGRQTNAKLGLQSRGQLEVGGRIACTQAWSVVGRTGALLKEWISARRCWTYKLEAQTQLK